MSGEKTEEPTDKKLSDQRRKGNVAKSKEVSSAAVLLVVIVLLFAMGPFMMKTLSGFMEKPWQYFSLPFDEGVAHLVPEAFKVLCVMTLPFLLAVMAAGIVGNVGQFGLLLSFEALSPNLGKLNPISNATNLFSKDNLFAFLASLLKFAVLGYVFVHSFMDSLDGLLKSMYGGVPNMLPVICVMLKANLKTFGIAAVLIAAVDFLFQKKRYIEKNKMSMEEVKKEHKESEGDPHMKHMRRHLAQEMLEHNALEETRQADVLIVNPTHYAVAIAYNPLRGKLPRLLAKGKDHLALKMREVAEEEDIPIMRDVPLARSLFSEGTVNHFIPIDLIKPVAETLKWAKSLRRENWN